MGTIVSVTSGKGGVGKTLTAINLAISARASGLSVLIVDGDLGLSNVDVLLGLKVEKTLNDLITIGGSASDIILKGPRGIHVLPSGSGISRMANLGPRERSLIISELAKLNDDYDLIIIDTGAGISQSVMALNAASDHVVVVTTPEPHSLTDAYAMIKVLAEEHDVAKVFLVSNQVRSDEEGSRIAQRLAEVSYQYVGSQVTLLASVRTDSVLQKSIMARNVAWDGSTHTLANQGWSSAWRRLSEVIQQKTQMNKYRDNSEVWSALSGKTVAASIV